MAEDDLERSEIEAHLETRHELGARYEAEIVDAFAERIEQAVAARSEEQLARARSSHQLAASAGPRQLALGIVSVVATIPVAIVLGVTGNLPALVVALAALVAVNLAHALQGRDRER